MNQSLLQTKLHYIIFFIILAIAAINIYKTLPQSDDYYYGADEGTYLRQATVVKEKGLTGFKDLAQSYAVSPVEQIFPPPSRVGHIYPLSLLLKFNNSMATLSYYSLGAFIALCVIFFLFMDEHWGKELALSAGTMFAFAPLLNGLARRAISESDYNLFFVGALLCFIDFVVANRPRSFYLFIAALAITATIKETVLFFIPFYVLVLAYYKFIEKKPFKLEQMVITAIVPPMIAGMIMVICFGGIGPIQVIFDALKKINVNVPHQYILDYNSGPWYSFFVDYFLLSPLVSLLGLLFVGYYLINKNRMITVNLLICYFIYFLLIFYTLPKNVRYGSVLNFVYIIFAALMIKELANRFLQDQQQRVIALSLATLLISFTGLGAYHHYFVNNKIYDPVSYNLLRAERFIPLVNPQPAPTNIPAGNDGSAMLNNLLKAVIDTPTAENYLNLSFYYYQQKQFQDSIKMSRKVLELSPQNVVAYNNLCSAYNDLKDWDKAIEAGTKALEIDPNYQLAKNNLEWAKSQKAKGAQ